MSIGLLREGGGGPVDAHESALQCLRAALDRTDDVDVRDSLSLGATTLHSVARGYGWGEHPQLDRVDERIADAQAIADDAAVRQECREARQILRGVGELTSGCRICNEPVDGRAHERCQTALEEGSFQRYQHHCRSPGCRHSFASAESRERHEESYHGGVDR